MSYSGSEQINVLGQPYLASKYSLTATVKVQTLCAIGTINTEVYERVSANFEIFITEDIDRFVHNAFTRTMFDIWGKNELYSGEYFYDFSIKGSDYLLTAMPNLANVKDFYFLWVNGRVVKIVFKGFQNGEGWGVMDSFTSDKLRIRLSDSEFKAYQFPLSAKKRFVKLYKSGFFN